MTGTDARDEMSAVDMVVVGMGYVGLPLAQEAVRSGLTVCGLDVDEAKVAMLNAGRSCTDDLSDQDVEAMLAAGFHATTDPECLARAVATLICVPTPLDADGLPALHAVVAALETIAARLHPGMLVVLESTTYPGTTEEVARPLLESTSGLRVGQDFHLAYSPERIDPGNRRYRFRTTPKVVGGVTPACAEAAASLYGKLVDVVVRVTGTREAEMAKLLENTYRHVNIALINEMAVFCAEMGIDLWEVIGAAATKPFGFEPFYPGPGVGGHCIPIDPNYLAYRVRRLGYPFRFVELAQEINARMPSYVVARGQQLLNAGALAVKGSSIHLLGVTYKADVADIRESPAREIGRRFLDLGAELSFHDPYVSSWDVNGVTLQRRDLSEAVAAADLVVVLQAHRAYDFAAIAQQARRMLDCRGVAAGPNVMRL